MSKCGKFSPGSMRTMSSQFLPLEVYLEAEKTTQAKAAKWIIVPHCPSCGRAVKNGGDNDLVICSSEDCRQPVRLSGRNVVV
jgi:hypothetical protein